MKGPGTAIKEMFSLMLIDAKPDCLCHQRAQYLDILGYRWAMQNIDTVIDWFEDEAKNRGMPFEREVAKRLAIVAMKRGVGRDARLQIFKQGHDTDKHGPVHMLWRNCRLAAMHVVGTAIGILCTSPIVRWIRVWYCGRGQREKAGKSS